MKIKFILWGSDAKVGTEVPRPLTPLTLASDVLRVLRQ